MSDLSWLNPTPHAIAVYASRPLSPVAAKHSLPSGRYSLTWAGLSPAGSHQLAAGARSGRDAIFIAPPAQNRTGGFPAYGLYGSFFVKGASRHFCRALFLHSFV